MADAGGKKAKQVERIIKSLLPQEGTTAWNPTNLRRRPARNPHSRGTASLTSEDISRSNSDNNSASGLGSGTLSPGLTSASNSASPQNPLPSEATHSVPPSSAFLSLSSSPNSESVVIPTTHHDFSGTFSRAPTSPDFELQGPETSEDLQETIWVKSAAGSSSPAISSSMAAPRNRAPRGTRSITDDTEEVVRWEEIRNDVQGPLQAMESEIAEITAEINRMTADFEKRKNGPNPATSQELETMDKLCRKLNKLSPIMRKFMMDLKEKVQTLKGAVAANEAPAAEPLRRGGSSRDGAKTFDPDGPSHSPAPSSSVDREKSNLKRVSRESRSSLPPKDTTTKNESSNAQTGSSGAGISTNAKGKIIFALGDEVAFRPKTEKKEQQDWIQGNVIKVIGEGKSRRYDVQDPEPDEKTMVGATYRTSASSMVAIPSEGSVLPDYAPKTPVLARYPDTTTFYTAEVIRMNGANVILRFEGEDEPEQTTEVERRLVLDFPRQ